jgi:hypothetical protein
MKFARKLGKGGKVGAAPVIIAKPASVNRSFDPTTEETLFFPRLVGG